MRYEWLLLDADGTLFDYDRAERQALERWAFCPRALALPSWARAGSWPGARPTAWHVIG